MRTDIWRRQFSDGLTIRAQRFFLTVTSNALMNEGRCLSSVHLTTQTNMKTALNCSALAILAIASASLASAVTPGLTATFTLALTVSEEDGGFPKNDNPYLNETTSANGNVFTEEYKSKIVATRVGVKEVLQEMIENGDITGPISGWSIVGAGEPDEDGEVSPTLFAVKTGQTPVLVNGGLGSGPAGNGISVWTYSQKTVYDSSKDTETRTGSGTSKADVDLYLFDSFMSGIATGSDKWVKGTLKVGTVSEPYEMYVTGAYSLKGISGSYESEDSYGVIEGTAGLAAAKVADVERFLEIVID